MARATPLLALALLLAGCAEPAPPTPPAEVPMAIVDGTVIDAALRPIANASVHAVLTSPPDDAATGNGEPAPLPMRTLAATTDTDGRFRLESSGRLGATLTVTAPGFAPRSVAVDAPAGGRAQATVVLERLADERPWAVVEEFQGILRCAAAVAFHTRPDEPHQDRTIRCTDALPVAPEAPEHVWSFRPDRNATAIVLEAAWDAQTEASQALTLRATDPATGAVVGFAEGTSVLRLQLGRVHVEALAKDGGTLLVEVVPGAGAGDHEDGAVGVFLDQPFELFATTFHNMPAPPAYSVAGQ